MNNYVLSLLQPRQALAGEVLQYLHQHPNINVLQGNWPQGYNNQHRNAVCQQLNMQPDDPMQVNVARIILLAITMVLNNHVIDVDTLRG
jgi:hypothetical protein